MKNKILLLIMMLVMAWQGAEAQTVVNYDSPKDYIIEGITVSGNKYLVIARLTHPRTHPTYRTFWARVTLPPYSAPPWTTR